MISGGWCRAACWRSAELRGRGDLGVRGVEAGARLQEDLDHADAVIGGRFDMLDVVDQRGHAQDHDRAEDQDQQRQHDEGVGPINLFALKLEGRLH
jgi:hypothetical protein